MFWLHRNRPLVFSSDRVRVDDATGQHDAPVGDVREMDDGVLQAPDEELALAGMCGGDVRDLFRQAGGQTDVRAIHRVRRRWQTRRPRLLAPAVLVLRSELPRLSDVMAESAGDHDVALNGNVGVGSD